MENRAQVRQLLEESGKVLAVVSAHAHWDNLTWHANIPFLTLQSMVEKVAEDTPAAAWSVLSVDPGSLRIETFGANRKEFNLGSSPENGQASRSKK